MVGLRLFRAWQWRDRDPALSRRARTWTRSGSVGLALKDALWRIPQCWAVSPETVSQKYSGARWKLFCVVEPASHFSQKTREMGHPYLRMPSFPITVL